MPNRIILTAIVLLLNFRVFAAGACDCTPVKTMQMSGYQCHIYADKTLSVFRSASSDGPTSDEIYLQHRRSEESAELLCNKGKAGIKFKLAERTLGCACDDRVVLFDAMSAPGTGSFVVLDTSGTKKFEDRHNDEPIEIKSGKIIYFAESKQIPEKKCPPERTVGVGCRELEKVSLELKDFKKTRLGEKRIIPIQ